MRGTKLIKFLIGLIIITGIIFTGLNLITANHDAIISSYEEISSDDDTQTKIFTGLDGIDNICVVTDFFTYGTSFCLSGSLSADTEKTVADVYIILAQAYDADSTSSDNEIYTYSALYEEADSSVSFSSYKYINEGINLENIGNGFYCVIIKAIYTDGTYEYYSLSSDESLSDASSDTICYYTVTDITKDTNQNRRIDIGFSSYEDTPYVYFNVCYDTLPDDVYDIVIDAGHGGTDVGAQNGLLYEADITLDYALNLKDSLEECGYKVKLTRDGSEDSDTPMAYTMYDDDGRVNVAGASNAKLCLSLHLNSNEDYVSEGGVQIYVSCRSSSSFAQTLADSISEYADTNKSDMEAYKITDGVYSRAFSESDIADSAAEAASGGYSPYDLDTNTDYYYMIRELGGIATNAYVDGRKSTYGANLYVDSIQGIESYIVELGFISVESDIKNILTNQDKYIEGIVAAINSRFQ